MEPRTADEYIFEEYLKYKKLAEEMKVKNKIFDSLLNFTVKNENDIHLYIGGKEYSIAVDRFIEILRTNHDISLAIGRALTNAK
jgi:hypothetical protein